MQKPHHCSRPQTTPEDIQLQILDHICNTRLRNLKKKTLRYHFKMVHFPGIKNRAPDTLSRDATGDHHPPKWFSMTTYTIFKIALLPLLSTFPTQLIAGICTDGQLHSIQMEHQLQESLTFFLHSTH